MFLKWVASFSHVDEETGSKMDLQNLATVICPSILYAKGRDAAREDSFTAIPVVTELLETQDEFYTVPDEFIPILNDQEYFANCTDMPCKDVMRKADTYLRLKQAGRSPFPGGSGMQPSGSGPGFANGRGGDGHDSRLNPQRSDPVLSRGRTPNVPNSEGFRSPPPLQTGGPSRSRERKQSMGDNPMSLGRMPPPPHGGFSHPSVTSPNPPSPRHQKPEQTWPMATPRPTPNAGNWSSGPDSRPSSFIRPNGDYFPPPANGRHSPASRF